MLASSREQADYFEEVVKIGGDAKLAANWVMVELGSLLNKLGIEIDQAPVSAAHLGGMLLRIRVQHHQRQDCQDRVRGHGRR